jgi:hypothetical protein
VASCISVLGELSLEIMYDEHQTKALENNLVGNHPSFAATFACLKVLMNIIFIDHVEGHLIDVI